MTGEAKEAKASESELSLSVIPVNESKNEEKTLALSSALAELVFQVIVMGLNRMRWEKKVLVKAHFLLMKQKSSDSWRRRNSNIT